MLTKLQYNEHYILYENYLKKMTQLLSDPKSTRDWKKEFNYNYAGIKFHELYFEHILSTPKQMPFEMRQLLKKNFGSIVNWKEDFIKSGESTKPTGWAFLCLNSDDNKLYNIISDSHDEFLIGMNPIIVMDMYEHSWFLQYGANKQQYILDFINWLDWDLVYERLNKGTKQ